MSNAKIVITDALWPGHDDVEDCYGFEDPLNWMFSEDLGDDIKSIDSFNKNCIIDSIWIYFNPPK